MTYERSLASGLVEELLDLVHKYDETLMVTTVVGALEIVKQQIIIDQMEFIEADDENEDDENEDDE